MRKTKYKLKLIHLSDLEKWSESSRWQKNLNKKLGDKNIQDTKLREEGGEEVLQATE